MGWLISLIPASKASQVCRDKPKSTTEAARLAETLMKNQQYSWDFRGRGDGGREGSLPWTQGWWLEDRPNNTTVKQDKEVSSNVSPPVLVPNADKKVMCLLLFWSPMQIRR